MSSLFTSDFPPYTIFPLREGEYYIAGGGGTSKTGVPNALEIRSLVYDGQTFVSQQVHRHDMADKLIMNSHPHPSDLCTLAVGIGADCSILKANREGNSTKGVEELRNFSLESIASIQTDFAAGADCYQKVVRFCYDGSMLVTGGMEGVVRVWKYPALKLLFDLKGHMNEIEDISCHPTEYKAVSVCRGGDLCVWDLVKGAKVEQKTWNPSKSTQYRFRAISYLPHQQGGSLGFYSINIPIKWNQRRKEHCYLVKWDNTTWKEVKRQTTGKELLSAMAISSSGDHIGVASAEGTVAIYSAKNLKLLVKVPHMHGFVVTSLAFVQARNKTSSVAKSPSSPPPCREALLSISADKSCCATSVLSNKDGVSACCGVSTGLFLLLPLLSLLVALLVLWAVVV